MATPRKISLVLADVDGTLVTEQKVLTDRARRAVAALRARGIKFAITSGRPPRGMAMLIEPLALDMPIAGFNGGLFVEPDLRVLDQKTIPAAIARRALALLGVHGLDAWLYTAEHWLVVDPDGPHVARETDTVRFPPKVVRAYDGVLDRAVKIVGVSDDHARVRRCETAAQAALGSDASARRSQPYYLDITNRDANKGAVLAYLARHSRIPPAEIATIGDQPNDTLMFERSGFSIAMGNASDEVKARADAVTASHDDDGFAKAMERFILDDGD